MRFQKGRNPVDRAHVARRVLGTLRSAYANDLQGYGFFAARYSAAQGRSFPCNAVPFSRHRWPFWCPSVNRNPNHRALPARDAAAS